MAKPRSVRKSFAHTPHVNLKLLVAISHFAGLVPCAVLACISMPNCEPRSSPHSSHFQTRAESLSFGFLDSASATEPGATKWRRSSVNDPSSALLSGSFCEIDDIVGEFWRL